MRIPVLLAAFVGAVLVGTASAATKKPAADSTPPPPPKEQPPKTTYTLTGEVRSVGGATLTIKGKEGQPDVVYDFTENTKILNGEKPVNLVEIKEGKVVGILARKSKGGDQVLLVNINGKEPLEKSDDKKDKKSGDKKSTDKKSTDKPKPKKKPTTTNNGTGE